MTELAGERSQGAADHRPGRGDSAGEATLTWSVRAGSAMALVEGSILLLVPLLVWAMGQNARTPGLGVLVAFGVLGIVLLRREASLRLRVWARLAIVPAVTATAAAFTLLLWRAPVVGFEDALRGSIRPWIAVTICVVVARFALVAVAPRAGMATVVDALDRFLKRSFDLVLSLVALVLTAPVGALVALAIWLEDRGPVFYRCDRVGGNGRRIEVLKFRKMQPDAGGPPLTSTDDDRFTRVGRFLARSKLDELPQLWNVLRGDMSLVGPRPEDPQFVEMYTDEFAEISEVRPGVTGLCQLAFAKESEIIDGEDRVRVYAERYLPAKLKIDLLYIERRSFLFDLKVLVWTALVLLRVDVAVNRDTGELTLRRRG